MALKALKFRRSQRRQNGPLRFAQSTTFRWRRTGPVVAFMMLALWCGRWVTAAAEEPSVRIATTLGDIIVAVDITHAPVSATNFLRYVDQGLYDGGRFHRTVTADNQPHNAVKIAVIQAGIDPARQQEEFAPIALERTTATGIKHLAGVISMARDGPDTATSDFFICVTDQPSLDFGGGRNPDGQGFAAFGRVVRGMDVVGRIQQSKAQQQTLTPPVKILSIRRVTPKLSSP
jgi:peptidyl-prolyl cis-trans isomerase A (cyclophilin A)